MDHPPEFGFIERLQAWLSRRAGWLSLIVIVSASWLINRIYFSGSWQRYTKTALLDLWVWLSKDPSSVWSALLLFTMTLFLAYANLYLKISVRSPNLQRRLSPRVFLSLPFLLYFGVYLTLAVVALVFFLKSVQPRYLAVLAASLIGIGAANTDIKFGGFNVQPLADFLRSLETVVEAGIGTMINELDIAKSSALRDQLASIPQAALERECRILGIEQTTLEKLKALSREDSDTYNGLLARELVRTSEANARRLIEAAREQSFISRLRRAANLS